MLAPNGYIILYYTNNIQEKELKQITKEKKQDYNNKIYKEFKTKILLNDYFNYK
tara:strand:- start:314 stop:475 length:162 start_codon:yes stop_codon:yes gene_type:complete